MKKLSRLKLKEFHEMNDFEMKKIIGGYDNETDGSKPHKCSYDRCSGDCVVGDGAEPHSNLYPGTCGWTLYPMTQCTCAAGFMG